MSPENLLETIPSSLGEVFVANKRPLHHVLMWLQNQTKKVSWARYKQRVESKPTCNTVPTTIPTLSSSRVPRTLMHFTDTPRRVNEQETSPAGLAQHWRPHIPRLRRYIYKHSLLWTESRSDISTQYAETTHSISKNLNLQLLNPIEISVVGLFLPINELEPHMDERTRNDRDYTLKNSRAAYLAHTTAIECVLWERETCFRAILLCLHDPNLTTAHTTQCCLHEIGVTARWGYRKTRAMALRSKSRC